jgi:hypothetical protein
MSEAAPRVAKVKAQTRRARADAGRAHVHARTRKQLQRAAARQATTKLVTPIQKTEDR